jgi:hypothetical protein
MPEVWGKQRRGGEAWDDKELEALRRARAPFRGTVDFKEVGKRIGRKPQDVEKMWKYIGANEVPRLERKEEKLERETAEEEGKFLS